MSILDITLINMDVFYDWARFWKIFHQDYDILALTNIIFFYTNIEL